METWRIIAMVLMMVFGGLLVLGSMGQTRDNRHRQGGDVARTALNGLAVLVPVVVLVAVVLPAWLCWAMITASVLIGSILMVTG